MIGLAMLPINGDLKLVIHRKMVTSGAIVVTHGLCYLRHCSFHHEGWYNFLHIKVLLQDFFVNRKHE